MKCGRATVRLVIFAVVAFCFELGCALLPSSEAYAGADDYFTYYVATSTGQSPIALNEGIMPFGDFANKRPAFCFDDPNPKTTTGGPSSMSLYVVEKNMWSQAQTQQHLTEGFGLKAPTTKMFGGSANYNSSVSSTIESDFSEDSIVVILQVDASTGTIRSQPTLNPLGKEQLAAGPLNFLQHCGVLYATGEDLGAHFYIVIKIYTESSEAKNDILRDIGYDGSLTIYGVSASSKITSTLDQKVDQKSGVTYFDINVIQRSGFALAGYGDLTSALKSVSQSPLQGAIDAAGKFLSAHNSDPGTADTFHFSLVSDLLGPQTLQYSNFDVRIAFAEKLLTARSAFEAMAALAEPSKTVPTTQSREDWASRYLLSGARNVICIDPHLFSPWTLIDTISCQSTSTSHGVAADWDKLLPAVDEMIANCMYTSDDQVATLCDPTKIIDRLINAGALFPSSAEGFTKWLGQDGYDDLKRKFPNFDVDGVLKKPDQALNQNVLNVIDAARVTIAARTFPEVASIDSLIAIYTKLSGKPDQSGDLDLASSRVPFANTELKSTTHQGCQFGDPLEGSVIKLDGTLDVSNLNYDIELNFTGPYFPDQLVITSVTPGHQNTYTVTEPQDGNPDLAPFAPSVWPWISSCPLSKAKAGEFDLKNKLLELGGSGSVVASYWDLHGHHTSTVETFRVANGQLFITNVFESQ